MVSDNHMKNGRALRIAIGISLLAILLLGGLVNAQGAMYPEAKLIVLSKESNVSVTFEGSGGPGDVTQYNNLFGLWSPSYKELFWANSTSPGTKFDLGYFPSYTELIFFIKSPDGTFLSGLGDRNPDGAVHSAITEIDSQTWRVGFEDLWGGGDRDYNDVTVLVKGDLYVIPPNPQKPDFLVLPGDITFSNNNPTEGDIVEIQAIIRNLGNSTDSNVSLEFYDGDPDNGGQLLSLATINGIGKEENITKTTQWDTTGKAGTHKIYVKVDPKNLIDETREDNNKANQEVVIAPTLTPTPTFNISGFKINNTTGSGVQGWNITLKNSTMQKSMLTGMDGLDGSYKFTNLVNGTYNVTEEMKTGWTNVSPMSQIVTIYGGNAMNVNFTNEPPIPVILVHGWMKKPDDNSWAETMKTRFTNAGFTAVEIFNYESIYSPIQTSAGLLAKNIEVVKKKYNSTKVDIVGHSEGGIVARTYINSYSYKNDVRKLVIIGSPNHGTDLPAFLFSLPPEIKKFFAIPIAIKYNIPLDVILLDVGIAAHQMEPHSFFLNSLNRNDNCADLQHGSYDRDYLNPLVHYYTITSRWYGLPTGRTIIHRHFNIFNFDLFNNYPLDDGDGLTADNSLKLTGVPFYVIDDVFHTDEVNSIAIIDKAISLIRGDISSSRAYVASNTEQTPDDVAVQWLPPIEGTIKSDEVKTHTIFIDNTTKKADFDLFWQGSESDLDLVLYTSSGLKINSSVNDSNINYTSDAMFKSYEVRSPEVGNWTIEISAVNVTNTGENYSVITFMETNLFVAAGTDKESYVPNEPITIAAYVQDNGTPLSNVNVNANISRPNGTNSTIQLYDDGLHNDNQTNDAIYANVYTDTNVSGVYYITTSANGMIRNESFERKAFKNVWVELYPDLTITSSDINFSNDTPVPGENITINATIHNIGDADANNASILFYDGDPAIDVLISEDKINVNVGQTARASISWNTTSGQHEIYVLISPFNEFLEKNYSNNKASRIINERQTPNQTPTPTPTPTGIGYDANGNGIIDKNEAVQAVMDYFSGMITRQQAIEVVMAYFNG